jgi:hypothetical protein
VRLLLLFQSSVPQLLWLVLSIPEFSLHCSATPEGIVFNSTGFASCIADFDSLPLSVVCLAASAAHCKIGCCWHRRCYLCNICASTLLLPLLLLLQRLLLLLLLIVNVVVLVVVVVVVVVVVRILILMLSLSVSLSCFSQSSPTVTMSLRQHLPPSPDLIITRTVAICWPDRNYYKCVLSGEPPICVANY